MKIWPLAGDDWPARGCIPTYLHIMTVSHTFWGHPSKPATLSAYVNCGPVIWILWHFYLDFCIHLKWQGGKSTEKSVFEKLEWEDFNNRWPPDCDSGHAPWSGSGVRLTSACGAPSLVRLWPLWPVMRTNCQEDHQHSLTGSCSAFTTFIIRCLSLAHWSHEAHTSVSHSQEVFAVQPFLERHNGFPSRGAGLGPVCVE